MSDNEEKIQENSENKSPEKHLMFEEDVTEAVFRILSVLSYFVVLVLIGLPVWWYTTAVYRAPLPLDDMSNYNVPNKTIRQNSIPLSLEYDVLITLINQEPETLDVDINIKELIAYLQVFLETVTPIANFTVKSQWLYKVDFGVVPKEENNRLILNEVQLPHLITPLEKKIWSHISPRPCLNLVLYIPKCSHPIFIVDSKQNQIDSNSFVNLRWGGVTILNADKTVCESRVFKPNIKDICNVFLTQLQNLLNLNSDTKEDILSLERVKAREMVDSSKRTLRSLAHLLKEINSIVISQEIAFKVKESMFYIEKAEECLSKNDVQNGLKAAKLAYLNAEEAFSDPSLLALLYFPDDQKYAVYIPLFLPIMIPVFMSLRTVRKWSRLIKDKKKSKMD